MRPQKSIIYLVFITALFVALPRQTVAGEKLIVYTSNYPLTYFAERIGREHINVVFPAPPDVDPAFWMPDSDTIRAFQQADLIILNGAGYEKWLKMVSLPMLRTVDTSRAFKEKLIFTEAIVTHNHGPQGDHSHTGTAFTTWLDFSLAIQQAQAIYEALSRKDPGHKGDFERNLKSLKTDLTLLDEEMTSMTTTHPGLPLVASHPIYQYMARRYNLNLKMVLWEPGTEPGKAEWNHLQKLVKSHPASWMIWEDDPLPESVKRLQRMNIESQVFSPCFSRPQQGNFLSVMKQNVKNMALLFN